MEDLIQNLRDAGCGAALAAEVCALYRAGRLREAVRRLRCHRCSLMDALHESQDRVDCLDHLVRRMEREAEKTTHEPQEANKWIPPYR